MFGWWVAGGLVMVASPLLDRVGCSCQPTSSLVRLKLGVVGECDVSLYSLTFLRYSEMVTYRTAIGGHDRCGAASLASTSLDASHRYRARIRCYLFPCMQHATRRACPPTIV